MAIIGVLAAILVPNMIGYLKDSKFSKANANAKQVYQSASNWAVKCEINNSPASDINMNSSLEFLKRSCGNKDEYTTSDLTYDGGDMYDLGRAMLVYMSGNDSNSIRAWSVI